ncbi:DUF5719 family protein [Microbacterium sp.]|uniref:DUF5719 family protein n=1 Tax=Microbacterium sp. TaxID=51671 RepID=UPI0039E7276C
MSRSKGWVGATARVAGGVVVAATFVVAMAGAVVVPWPTHRAEPPAVTTLPEPADAVVACAGSLLTLGRDAANATGLADAAGVDLTAAAAAGAEVTQSTLAASDVPAGTGPTALVTAPHDGARTDVAAAQSVTASDADLRGFAASACTPPLMESWLVGGSAATGAADLVLLSNPGEVAALVDLTVYGVGGGTVPSAGRDIVVPPASQRVVPLAALGLGEKSPVVRVSATGAPVQAALQASVTRTLVPGGVEQVGVAAAPASVQLVPAFSVTRAPGEPGASDIMTLARLLAPSADATATVTVTPVGGGSSPIEPLSVPLTAGAPLELELEGLPIGSYTARIEATAPVVAAVWSATGFVAGSDFGWYAATEAVAVPSLVAVADGASPVLTIANPGEAPISVGLVDAAGAGATVTLQVPAHGAVQRSVAAGAVYLLVPDAPVHANVAYAGEGALAAYAVTPADTAAPAVVVHPG